MRWMTLPQNEIEKNPLPMKPTKPVPKTSTEPSAGEVNALLALYNARRYAEAEHGARALLEEYPRFAFGWKLLGGILQSQGKDALAEFKKVTELTPADPEAHYNLGVVFKGAGHLEEAAVSYRKAIQLKADYAEAHSNLGNTLNDLGQHKEAITSYRQALCIKPGDVDAHNNLGTALKDLGQLDDAIASYRRAVALKPDFVLAHYNLGKALKQHGQVEAAIASYGKVIALKPDYAHSHADLGKALHKNGQLDEASDCFRNALEIDPENIKALLGASYLFAISGEIKKAEEYIQKLLKIDPSHTEARLLLASVKKTQPDDENLAALVALANSEQNSERSIYLHFKLGKCFDDIGKHDKAFSHFVSGCKLKRATFEYDPEKSTQTIDGIIKVFNQTTIERLQGGGISSDLPIFVLGMPRSGTTLTEQIIASHPDVHGAGELPDLNKIVQRYVAENGIDFPGNILALNHADLGTWASNYVNGLQRRAPYARRITDKFLFSWNVTLDVA